MFSNPFELLGSSEADGGANESPAAAGGRVEASRPAADARRGDSQPSRRGGRGGGRGGKRQFDRHSGTGRPLNQTEKKSGAGRRNWGREGDSAAAAAAVAGESGDAEVPEGDPNFIPEDDESAEGESPRTKLMSLAEYRERQAAESPSIALPEPRKPQTGDDKGMTALPKKDEVDEDVFMPVSGGKKRRSKKNTGHGVTVPVDQVLNVRAPRDSDSRGGRGGGRGRGGRGERGDRFGRDGPRPERPERSERAGSGESRRGGGGGGRGGRGGRGGGGEGRGGFGEGRGGRGEGRGGFGEGRGGGRGGFGEGRGGRGEGRGGFGEGRGGRGEGRGGFGGRGRGEGRGGRGFARGGPGARGGRGGAGAPRRDPAAPVAIDDTSAFPALGA